MILLNGQPAASIGVLDRGLHYGDGLFETIAVVNGTPLLWQRHMARLEEGCRRLGLNRPDPGLLATECTQASDAAPRAVVKILVTRGAGGRGYKPPVTPAATRLVMGFPWPAYPDDYQRTGVAVRLCQTRLSRNPVLAGIKHLNRLEQVLARSEWNDEGLGEGLMLDTAGNLVEGTMSNLFLVEGNKLVTPDLQQSGIAGVMRAQVLECADTLAIPYEITAVSVERARAADGLFLTNCVIGLWPICDFEHRSYAMHPLVERLRQQLRLDNACA